MKVVLLTLQDKHLCARQSKCYFIVDKVEYFFHFIFGEGVATDPSKIAPMVKYPL